MILKNLINSFKHSKPKIILNKLNKATFASYKPKKTVNLESYKKEQTLKPVKSNNKFDIDPNNLDDYLIVGAEIFKNSFKDALIKQKEENSEKQLSVIVQDLRENEKYGPVTEELINTGFTDNTKHLMQRPYYGFVSENLRQKFAPSHRFTVEPFNSIPVFKSGLSGNSREEHNLLIFKRNEYLKEFVRPFNINLPDLKNLLEKFRNIENTIQFNSFEFQKYITNFYLNENQVNDPNIKEYLETVNSIVDIIPHTNHSLYPNLLMALFYDYGINEKRIWITIEQEILNNLHHYNVKDICKIYHIAYISSPKYSTLRFRQTLHSEIFKQLNNMTVEELNYVCLGFRMSKDKNLYKNIVEQYIKRKDDLTKDEKNLPQNLSNMFYSYASNFPKYQAVDTFFPQKEIVDKFIETFEDELNGSILKMDQFEIARFATSLYLLKYEYVDLFVK